MTAELVRRLLPALMSVGAGLGVALHTVLATWGSTISMGAVPSLQADPHGLSLAYRGHGGQDPLIPIRIDSKGGGSAEDN